MHTLYPNQISGFPEWLEEPMQAYIPELQSSSTQFARKLHYERTHRTLCLPLGSRFHSEGHWFCCSQRRLELHQISEWWTIFRLRWGRPMWEGDAILRGRQLLPMQWIVWCWIVPNSLPLALQRYSVYFLCNLRIIPVIIQLCIFKSLHEKAAKWDHWQVIRHLYLSH